VVDVTNPVTGKTWMDRNLGASRVAQSSTDSLAYGDLYQWGRGSDGHHCRSNLETYGYKSSTDQPSHGNFINSDDWRGPKNDNLWQGANGINNPCPSGYRIPTIAELESEKLSWNEINANGAFSSPLKFSLGGNKSYSGGNITNVNSLGLFWSSSVNGDDSQYLFIDLNSSSINPFPGKRGLGFSVRCIKD
jgi:hypothetical protein